MYVLERTNQGGGYVAKPGKDGSYTSKLQHARMFATREQAERERCPENEHVVTIEDAMR